MSFLIPKIFIASHQRHHHQRLESFSNIIRLPYNIVNRV